jgi:hypothetical protein
MPKKHAEPPNPLAVMFRVRVVFGAGAFIHLLSETEPVVTSSCGVIENVALTLVQGTEHGDTVGFIRWSDVSCVTWRKA